MREPQLLSALAHHPGGVQLNIVNKRARLATHYYHGHKRPSSAHGPIIRSSGTTWQEAVLSVAPDVLKLVQERAGTCRHCAAVQEQIRCWGLQESALNADLRATDQAAVGALQLLLQALEASQVSPDGTVVTLHLPEFTAFHRADIIGLLKNMIAHFATLRP
jgi:hypothetical protein